MQGVILSIPGGGNLAPIQEISFLQSGAEHPAAFEHELGILKSGQAGWGSSRAQGGVGHLIHIAPGVAPTEDKILAVLLGHKTEGEGGLFFDKVHGVAVGTHKDKGDRAVPEKTNAAPAGSHTIEVFCRAGGDEHPLLSDELHRVPADFCNVDILHKNAFLLTKPARPQARRVK